jgi:hypothetical protein
VRRLIRRRKQFAIRALSFRQFIIISKRSA